MREALFKEVAWRQTRKARENACGDAFLSYRDRDSGRVVSVLSDGLGSGVKAGIMAAMTAKMALKFALSEMDTVRTAEIMMDAMPICAVRKIGYATWTVVDCRENRTVRIIEQGNPGFLYIREGRRFDPPSVELCSRRYAHRKLRVSELEAQPEDRIVFFSDGVTEAGMGSAAYKLGWRRAGVEAFVFEMLAAEPGLSAQELANRTVQAAINKEPSRRAGDDTTCAAVYMRRPRRTLLLSGPPFSRERDADYARLADRFEGRRIVCGGTSADILSRELGKPIETPLRMGNGRLPPVSRMEGMDLVTEGILTLTATQRYLESGEPPSQPDAASRLFELLCDSDVIEIVVGTRINEAHQDPNLPVELDIRRNLLKQMKQVLETRYLKEVNLRYL